MNYALNFLSGFIGAIAGAVVTYFVMRSLQRRAWKREDVKEIFAPLCSEITSVKSKCEELYRIPIEIKEWSRIKKEHLFWLIPKELRWNIEKFYEGDLEEYRRLWDKGIRKIIDMMKEFLTSQEDKRRTGEWNKEIPDKWDSYETDRNNFLDYSSGIAKFILSENLDDGYLNQGFERVKRFLGINFDSIKEFYNYFLNKFKKTEEYKGIHRKKGEILRKIDKLLKDLKRKMDVK